MAKKKSHDPPLVVAAAMMISCGFEPHEKPIDFWPKPPVIDIAIKLEGKMVLIN